MSELSDLTQSLSGGYCQQCSVKGYYVFYNSKMSSTQITISSNNEKNSLKLSEGETGKIIEKFCESTSLHGFSFLHKANTVAVKLICLKQIPPLPVEAKVYNSSIFCSLPFKSFLLFPATWTVTVELRIK